MSSRRNPARTAAVALSMATSLTGVVVTTTPPAAAVDSSVYAHVRRYLDWTVPYTRALTVSVISTQPAAGTEGAQTVGAASYADGFLTEPSNNPNRVEGSLNQYFNDRRHTPSAHPFDPARRDSLGVHITANPADQSVTVTLVALSWGGASQNLTNLRVEDGVLVGDGASVGNQTPSALYAVSLGTTTIPG